MITVHTDVGRSVPPDSPFKKYNGKTYDMLLKQYNRVVNVIGLIRWGMNETYIWHRGIAVLDQNDTSGHIYFEMSLTE